MDREVVHYWFSKETMFLLSNNDFVLSGIITSFELACGLYDSLSLLSAEYDDACNKKLPLVSYVIFEGLTVKPLCVHLKQLLWYNVPFIDTFTKST